MQATMKTHGWQLTPHLEIGYNYRSNWFGIEPFVLSDFISCWEQSAKESGAPTLNMHQDGRYCSLLRSEVGVNFVQILTYDFGTITLMEKGSYGYQKTFHTGTIHAFLIGSPGSFTVTTLTGAQNLGIGEFEVLVEPKNNRYPYANISCHAEAGSNYQAYQGTLELGKNF
jgi:uncharacterized protein with beta-barrel porin domain